MKLTNQALKDSRNFKPESISQTCVNAITVEWFDSVGIFIDIKSKFGISKNKQIFSFSVKGSSSGFKYLSRQEATKEAIIKANNIYNEKINKH